MNIQPLKEEVKVLVDHSEDVALLEALRDLLKGEPKTLYDHLEMNRMAQLSEADIKAGRVYSREEVEQWLKEQRAKDRDLSTSICVRG